MKPVKISYTAPKGAGVPDQHEVAGQTIVSGGKPVLTIDPLLISEAKKNGMLKVEDPDADAAAKLDAQQKQAAQAEQDRVRRGGKAADAGKSKPSAKSASKPKGRARKGSARKASGGGGGAEQANAKLGNKMNQPRNEPKPATGPASYGSKFSAPKTEVKP